MSGVSVGSGLTYQWQSSADGITFSDISTATSSSLSTTQSVLTYYQAIVTCSAGTIATSTPLMVEMGNCVVMTNGSDTTCNGIFYDSGAGNGNYSDYENTTMTLYPSTPGTFLQVNFYSFQLETCCDDLTVYNGNSTASPLLGSFSTNPGSITSTALDGSLTFTFSSDGSVTYFGWEASISCVEPPVNDDVCAAIAVSVDGSTNSYNNGGAGIQTDEQTIAPPASGDNTSDGWGDSTITASTWFMFDAPASGNVTINCTDINFDGQVAIYSVADCSDFSSFTLIAANDDALDNSSVAPEFTICGLNPDSTYYLLYDSRSIYSTGAFSLQISPLTVSAGTTTSLLNTCAGDTVNLFSGITSNDANGIWYEMLETTGLTDSLFNSTGLAYQVFDFNYIVVDGCATDTSLAQVQIYGESNAGDGGSITVCRNEPIDLLAALNGNVDLGGTWYNPSNQVMASSFIYASNIPGQFNYDYITGNGVCANDSSVVLINVDMNCNWLSIEEMFFASLSISPNPTNGKIFISNEGSTEQFNYEITNLDGRIISTKMAAINGISVTEIDFTGNKTGMYIIRIFNSNAEKVFRIILQ